MGNCIGTPMLLLDIGSMLRRGIWLLNIGAPKPSMPPLQYELGDPRFMELLGIGGNNMGGGIHDDEDEGRYSPSAFPGINRGGGCVVL